MLKTKIFVLCQLLWIFTWIKPVFAQDNIPERKIFLNNSMDMYSVGLVLDYLEDKDKSLKIEHILANTDGKNELQWIKSYRKTLGFGFTGSSYWVRFTVANPHKKEIGWLLEADYPLIDSIELYKSADKDHFEMKRAGDSLPFEERDIKYRNFVFDLAQAPETQSTYYMRFETSSSMVIALWIWSPYMLIQKINKESVFLWLYYGILFVVALYSLLSFLFFREKAYLFLYYFLWIISYALYQMSINGLSFQYFWPGSPWMANLSVPFFIFFGTIWCLHFGKIFLNTKEELPLIDKFIKYLMFLAAAGMLITLVIPYSMAIRISSTMVLIVVSLMLATGLISMYYGLTFARYYVIAWTALFLGGTAFVLKSMGFLPDNFITNWSPQIGSVLQVILLSMALVDYFDVISREKEDAQNEAIDALRLAARQHNEFLEQTTRKNTEIESLNAKLEKRLYDLCEANEKIAISEEKYRILVEGSNDIIFSLDEKFNFITVSNAVTAHLNIKPGALKSKHFLDLIHEGSERVSVSKQLVQEKLELFAADKKPVSFKTDFAVSFTSEPKEMRVYLEYINIEGRNEILGKAARVEDDVLLKCIEFERQQLTIGNYFITAEEISHRLTRNLAKYMDHKKVYILRIALREIIINAIEHGNLNISFEEKTQLMEEDNYFQFLSERQQDPIYIDRHVIIEYSMDTQKVSYIITDAGDGFDHKKILNDPVNVNEEMLAHGRGILMAKNCFDEINYNDKGNQVMLVKYFNAASRN